MREAIDRRMLEVGLTSLTAFARAAGLTANGLRPVRQGQYKRYPASTRVGVARALCWPGDWYERMLSGEDPARFEHVDWPPPVGSPEDAIRRLEAEKAQLERENADLERRIAAAEAQVAELLRRNE